MNAHTPGPWTFALYFQDAEQLAELQRFGMTPTRCLLNDGSAPVMADGARVALIDCQTPYKRGKGHETECAERDANARLIAAAPDLLDALRAMLGDTPPAGEPGHVDFADAVKMARAALARVQGGDA